MGTWFMFLLLNVDMGVIIDFCLHFRLGELGIISKSTMLRIISKSTKRLLRDNERIKWNEDYLFDDYDYGDYDDD